MGASRETPHLLIIVSSTDSARFEYLKHVFASSARVQEATVEVIVDRRAGERRQLRKPVALERRHRERRMRDVSKDLAALRWAMVRR
jgi:hypothetical protein